MSDSKQEAALDGQAAYKAWKAKQDAYHAQQNARNARQESQPAQDAITSHEASTGAGCTSQVDEVTFTSNQNPPAHSNEGEGMRLISNQKPRQDMRTEERAIKRRWPSTQERRTRLMNELFHVALNSRDRPHLQARAASVILAAERADNQLICSDTAAKARRDVGPSQVTVNVQVAAREAAVFGAIDSAAFAAAARRQLNERAEYNETYNSVIPDDGQSTQGKAGQDDTAK